MSGNRTHVPDGLIKKVVDVADWLTAGILGADHSRDSPLSLDITLIELINIKILGVASKVLIKKIKNIVSTQSLENEKKNELENRTSSIYTTGGKKGSRLRKKHKNLETTEKDNEVEARVKQGIERYYYSMLRRENTILICSNLGILNHRIPNTDIRKFNE